MEERSGILRELRICRFCLTEEEPLNNIYIKDKSNTIPLPLQIMACVALEVFANDGMPQLICEECRTQLKKSYSFKTLCKRSDDSLKLYLATGILRNGDRVIETIKSGIASKEIDCPPAAKRKKIEEQQPDINLQQTTIDITIVPDAQTLNAGVIEDQTIVISVPPEDTKLFTEEQVEQINEPEIKKLKEEEEIIQETENTSEIQDISCNPDLQVITESSIDLQVSKIPTQCFSCSHCERSFPLQQLLDIHMRQHTRERKFNCDLCLKKFFSKHDLTKHYQIHTGYKPFTCIICEKSFSRATLLHRHEKVHILEPKYLCTYCDKTFLASEDLDTHMKTHKKNRPFKCSLCDKRFAFKQGLDRHEQTHNAENLHKCNYCEESFRTPSKLQRHITCHAGARPYPCKLCPRTFLLSHHLSRHLRNHSSSKNKNEEAGEHKCDVCSMSFKRRHSLINHSAIHSMVNLKCVICNKEFEDAQTVKNHINTHLGGLPFMCFKCEYSFENEEDLLEHEQKHFDEADSESDQEVEYIEDETPQPRRSLRDRKEKKYSDFLKDEDFSESEENNQSDEEFTPKATVFQPVVRSETMKVYKGVREKKDVKVTPQIKQEVVEKVIEAVPKEQKTLTKITTLENLGISKSTLDAITEKSGFVEMKIGQKVIRVQKLMMSKADVQAMADQGKIEMKGTKVVVKNSGGMLDLNKLTNINKPEEKVRTYVMKLAKENLNENMSQIPAKTENIDVQTATDENTTEIMNF